MTQWWNEQTANQRLLDLNRELRQRADTWEQAAKEKIRERDSLLDLNEKLREENAWLEADNAKLVAGLTYDPNDRW